MNQAHRDPTIVPTEPRMRDYWKFHGEGTHKEPREGVKPDHYYSCSWCRPHYTYNPQMVYGVMEGECEVFHLPQEAASNPMAAIAGRIG